MTKTHLRKTFALDVSLHVQINRNGQNKKKEQNKKKLE
jgi:hypothetical protein